MMPKNNGDLEEWGYGIDECIFFCYNFKPRGKSNYLGPGNADCPKTQETSLNFH
jgi:hypothetical protein